MNLHGQQKPHEGASWLSFYVADLLLGGMWLSCFGGGVRGEALSGGYVAVVVLCLRGGMGAIGVTHASASGEK